MSIQGATQSIAPVLADVRDADKLYELARDRRPEARADLAKIVAAILQKNVSQRESELVADVLIELLHQAEKDLRMALSEQLSIMDNVPLRLVLQIANDDIKIASPVLRRSSVLSDMDLIYIIKSKPAEYWRVIAERKALGSQTIDVLAEAGDFETALNLAENQSITLTEHALVILSDIAQNDQRLSMPLLQREDVPGDIAAKLYEYVGQEVKHYILENYDVNTDQLIKCVDKTVENFAVEIEENRGFLPDEYMIEDARNFKKKGLLTIKFVLETLRRGHMRSFVAQFSIYTGFAPRIVEELIRQSHGQGFAVLCRAKNIEKSDFVSLYMLTNRIRSTGYTVDLNEMKKAVSYYNRITPEMAKTIIAGSQDQWTSLH